MVNGLHLVQSEADIAQDLAMVSGNFSSDFTVFTLRMYIVPFLHVCTLLQKWSLCLV